LNTKDRLDVGYHLEVFGSGTGQAQNHTDRVNACYTDLVAAVQNRNIFGKSARRFYHRRSELDLKSPEPTCSNCSYTIHPDVGVPTTPGAARQSARDQKITNKSSTLKVAQHLNAIGNCLSRRSVHPGDDPRTLNGGMANPNRFGRR